MKPFKDWPNPKEIGQAEYSMIHELCRDALNDRAEDWNELYDLTKEAKAALQIKD